MQKNWPFILHGGLFYYEKIILIYQMNKEMMKRWVVLMGAFRSSTIIFIWRCHFGKYIDDHT